LAKIVDQRFVVVSQLNQEKRKSGMAKQGKTQKRINKDAKAHK